MLPACSRRPAYKNAHTLLRRGRKKGNVNDVQDLPWLLYVAMDKAGIERKVARSYGFHLFRHSAGSQTQEVAGDLKQTQGFLGHSSIGITSDVYVHLQPDSTVESMKKLEENFFSELCSNASVVTLKPANGGQGKTGQRKGPGTKLFYPAASCRGKSIFVRQLRGPHLST